METPGTHCRNCEASVDGEYCKSCGQREGRGDLHFADAAGDILGDIFTLDSRVWRTLFPLFFKPGFLSAEFNAGRRARYMPPFRLYLVVSFLMFLGMSFDAGESYRLSTSGELDDAAEIVDDSPADAQSGSGNPRDNPQDLPPEEFSLDIVGDGPPWMLDLERRLEANARRVSQEPGDYMQELLEYLPRVMFVMLPIFALLLKLAYLFSPYHYLQHLVFAVHYHTFVYLLYLVSIGVERIAPAADAPQALLLLVYLPLALRRTYASGWGGAIGKSLFLMISYGITLILGASIAALAVLAAM